ncbi:hypothetical protein KCP77_05190 [Salmonella enterica subsp. enterica]|nr:hypothetical protein KCP77_05190 [Salmonella enterica subsp. enterica]
MVQSQALEHSVERTILSRAVCLVCDDDIGVSKSERLRKALPFPGRLPIRALSSTILAMLRRPVTYRWQSVLLGGTGAQWPCAGGERHPILQQFQPSCCSVWQTISARWHAQRENESAAAFAANACALADRVLPVVAQRPDS